MTWLAGAAVAARRDVAVGSTRDIRDGRGGALAAGFGQLPGESILRAEAIRAPSDDARIPNRGRAESDLALADFKAGIGVTDGKILNSSFWQADPALGRSRDRRRLDRRLGRQRRFRHANPRPECLRDAGNRRCDYV